MPAQSTAAAAATADGAALFETSVRPLLSERCAGCHSAKVGKVKGGLDLDTLAGLLQGGDGGAAIVPGHPEQSLLIRAVGYDDETLKMPPKGRLTSRQVADLSAWIAAGAPWPGSSAAPATRPAGIDMPARMQAWTWKPVVSVSPPAVSDHAWPRDDIDQFVLAKLEAAKLRPADPADKRTLIRRLSFDLTGLPPTPAQVRAFVDDPSPDAVSKVVDRLLASPAFGERWGRHWLDVMRYADTAGQEHDDPIPYAWRYRDYVIRAFNDDVPYDQLVREHLAGDLLPAPRVHPTAGTNESILGTAFWFLGEAGRAPTDVRYDQFFRTDNQIDTLGKAFLGLPLGCAQCHDHKFDPIPQSDYYALWGFAESTRRQEALLDPHGKIALAARQTRLLRSTGTSLLRQTLPGANRAAVETADQSKPPAGTEILADFRAAGSYQGWYRTGDAFGERPVAAGEWDPSAAPPVMALAAGAAHSGAGGRAFAGVLRSRSFILTRPTLLYRLAGRGGKVRLIINGYTQDTYDPLLFRGATFTVDHDQMTWHRQAQDVSRYVGQRAYIELIDDGDGWLAVEQILLADTDAALPPETATPALMEIDAAVRTRLTDLAKQIEAIAASAPSPVRALAAADGDGFDEHVLLRGNHKTPGPVAARQFLQALSPADQAPIGSDSSGRLELARRMTDPSANPLLARVMVNRIWHHLLGRGIVASTDSFGALGDRPTHPELLDHLADRFVREGWSVKKLIRAIVLSRTYQMAASSADAAAADRIDPGNTLLHRARIRRLQAEAVRDALLATAGELQPAATRPGDEGNVFDAAANVRSVYLPVRRSAPVPLLQAFDAPWPYYATGRRDVSNVPAQALILMNDPFVHRLAAAWANDTLAATPEGSVGDRLDHMYERAFARLPTAAERQAVEQFLAAQGADLGIVPEGQAEDRRLWSEIAHALINAKEFTYIE